MAFLVVVAVSLIFSPAKSQAREIHMTVGVGTNFSFPGTIRLGWEDWEVGLLAPAMYGIDKVFSKDSWYTAFGFGLSTSFGFYAGAGYVARVWKIGLRAELTATMDINAFTQGIGVVGLSYGF